MGLFLIRHLSHKFDGFHWTGFDAGLLAADTSLFIPERSVDAQVALGRFLFKVIPYGAVRLLRAHFDAGLAANAFLAVNPSHISISNIHICCADRATLNTNRCFALTAWRHLDVIGEFSKRVLHNLKAR